MSPKLEGSRIYEPEVGGFTNIRARSWRVPEYMSPKLEGSQIYEPEVGGLTNI